MSAKKNWVACSIGIALAAVAGPNIEASGHGPVFGAATPTLGRGGWSVDQAWTVRFGDQAGHEQMLKTMVTFGITEVLQISGSVPLVMSEAALESARMMSPMSSDREFEALAGWRFQRRPIGIGARQESTLYVGGTAPMESRRDGVSVGPSIEIGGATGYASRAHYFWVGGGLQHYFESGEDRLGDSRLATVVYGYRPPAMRTEAGRPDLRFFVEATFEDRQGDRIDGADRGAGARTFFLGPTSLLVYKAIAIEGGVLFPVYQREAAGSVPERLRLAFNVSYFFWLK
jgi:hypothetical protein